MLRIMDDATDGPKESCEGRSSSNEKNGEQAQAAHKNFSPKENEARGRVAAACVNQRT
jgi:hypothetical protein